MKALNRRSERSVPTPIIVLLTIGVSVGFVSLVSLFRESLSPSESQQIEVRSGDPGLEHQVSGIAAQFMCTCGNCADQKLDQCPCETAQGARQMIRASLQSGRPASQVFAAVDSAYGGRILKVN